MIHVGIVEPYEILRKGLSSLIKECGGMRIVAEAGNVADMAAQLEGARIDVLVLEPLAAWGLNLEAVRVIQSKMDNFRILVFSESTAEDKVQAALRAGIVGFVSKRARLSELIQGIQNLARGEPFLCAEVTAKLTNCIINTFSKHPHELLSNRELEILLLLVNGKSIADAAHELNLSVKTVSTHKMRLMQKMELESFSKLVQYATAHGLISNSAKDSN
ncbi:LuxR C-terminal-related transcriptional regulator [Massilia litorea]|uniref:Response regulator transcription factor n=1 Tax=Massilia litorea TaxID=2769491 RepID=A0A7L9U1K0_9BURK|nr:response regulator transcription factor [Massilia litorea]QOL48152.1 response regulator transcription factor [Massilia litorea]